MSTTWLNEHTMIRCPNTLGHTESTWRYDSTYRHVVNINAQELVLLSSHIFSARRQLFIRDSVLETVFVKANHKLLTVHLIIFSPFLIQTVIESATQKYIPSWLTWLTLPELWRQLSLHFFESYCTVLETVSVLLLAPAWLTSFQSYRKTVYYHVLWCGFLKDIL